MSKTNINGVGVGVSVNEAQIRQDAIEAHSNGDYTCAAAVTWAIGKNLAPEMPQALHHAAAAFSTGVGGAGCLCGAISGGVLALGYFFGRCFPTTITDPQSQKTIALSYQLQDAFKARHGLLCCHALDKTQCGQYVGDAAALTAEIIANELGGGVVGNKNGRNHRK